MGETSLEKEGEVNPAHDLIRCVVRGPFRPCEHSARFSDSASCFGLRGPKAADAMLANDSPKNGKWTAKFEE